MAGIHPELMTVLSGLLESHLPILGEIAIAPIQEDDLELERRTAEFPDQIPETSRRRGFRQLQAANAAIMRVINEGLSCMKRLTELAEQFEIDKICALPSESQVEGTVSRSVDFLISPIRIKQVGAFIGVWSEVVNDLNVRWEGLPDAQ